MKKFLTVLFIAIAICSVVLIGTETVQVTVTEDLNASNTQCINHIYANNGEYVVINEPTCSLEGTKYRTCLVCGDKEIVKTPKNPDNHSSVSSLLTYEKKPTCVEGGIGHYVCKGCNKSAKRVELSPEPTAHLKNGDFVVIQNETCKADGTMAHQCKYCNEYFNHQTIPLNPESHVTNENSIWNIVKMPTCAEKGEMVCYCEFCSKVAITKEIVPTGKHILSDEWTVIQDETCSADGAKARLCTVCNQPQNITAVPMNQEKHSFDSDFTVDNAPTCVSGGEKSKHCQYCDARTGVTEVSADPSAHIYGDEWVVTKEATCAENGYKHKICTNCGVTSVSTLIEKLPHTYPETYEIIQTSADGLSARVKYICIICGYEYITIEKFGDNVGDGNIGDDIDPIIKIHKIKPVDNTVIKVDYEKMVISNVIRKMYISDFFAKFKNSNVYVVYNNKNEFANEDEFIGTGFRLNHETPDGIVTNYYVSVTGDIDSDGMITASDARLALRASAKIENLSGAYFVAADVNGDEKLTAADARRILLVAAGLDFFDDTYEMPK